MRILRLSTISVMLFLGMVSLGHALNLTQTQDASTLVNNILGTGIVIVGTPTYTGEFNQSGTFTNGGASGISFDEGIVLTTGNINDIPGPNNPAIETLSSENLGSSDDISTSLGTSGEAMLSSIAGDFTFDAAILQFDFQFGDGTTGGDLFFNYQFASEEYLNYVDSKFNDVFAFFLDGTNVALVPPSGGTAVSVNTVNSNVNSGFFVNNVNNTNGIPNQGLNNHFDGLTTGLSVKALGISAGVHNIKMAIADVSDSALDSGVFIQAGTFSLEETPQNNNDNTGTVPEPNRLILLGIVFGIFAFRKKILKNV